MATAGWQHTLVLCFLSFLGFFSPCSPRPEKYPERGVQAAALQGREVRFTSARWLLCLDQLHLDKQQYMNKQL